MSKNEFVITDNLAEASKALKRWGILASRELNPKLREVGRPIFEAAKRATPVNKGQVSRKRGGRVGNLRRGVKWSFTANGIKLVSRAPHSHFITQGIAGRKGSSAKARKTKYGQNYFLHKGIGINRHLVEDKFAEALDEWFAKAHAVVDAEAKGLQD